MRRWVRRWRRWSHSCKLTADSCIFSGVVLGLLAVGKAAGIPGGSLLSPVAPRWNSRRGATTMQSPSAPMSLGRNSRPRLTTKHGTGTRTCNMH